MGNKYEQLTDIYYRIRFLDKIGTPDEYYVPKNGTGIYESLSEVKLALSQGRRTGYQGRLKMPFENYEIVEFVDSIRRITNIIVIDGFKIGRKKRRKSKNNSEIKFTIKDIDNIRKNEL
jgi:hypothetical protein